MDLTSYTLAWKERFHKRREEIERRRLAALQAAAVAARMLRDRFGATRVVLFGSALKPGHFSQESDIDIAIEGVPATLLFEAETECTRATRFEVQLVPIRDASASLQDAIESEGIELP